MNPWKITALGVLLLVVGWHLIIALTPRITLAGPFLTKPADPGYVWSDTENPDSRFFWQTTSTKWLAGLAHPDYNAEAAPKEGDWIPAPGYAFVDQTQGLETVWTKGLKHPDYMAWSDEVEGKWIPVTGYRFIYDGDMFVDSVWDPNKRYDDIKVISLQEKDHYKPFPGYAFTEPGKSLVVAWKPGLPNSDNPQLVAGGKEGTWTVRTSSSAYRPRRSSNDAALFFGGVATGVLLRSL